MGEKLTAHKPQSDEDISFVKGRYKKHHNSHIHAHGNGRPHTKPPGKSLHSNTSRKCGKKWPHKKSPYQAQGCTCRKCGKPNHFAKMCRTVVILKRGTGQQSKVQVVNEEESESSCSDDEYLYSAGSSKSKISTVLVKFNNVKTRMIIDTGASTDILNEIAFAHINQKNNITLQPSSKRLLAYGSTNQLAAREQGNYRVSSLFKTDNATHGYMYSRENLE